MNRELNIVYGVIGPAHFKLFNRNQNGEIQITEGANSYKLKFNKDFFNYKITNECGEIAYYSKILSRNRILQFLRVGNQVFYNKYDEKVVFFNQYVGNRENNVVFQDGTTIDYDSRKLELALDDRNFVCFERNEQKVTFKCQKRYLSEFTIIAVKIWNVATDNLS